MTDHADLLGLHLTTALDEIATALVGGFDLGDVTLIVKKSMEVADLITEGTGEEKAAFAKRFAHELLREQLGSCGPKLSALIEAVDIPFMPEAMERAVVDPILKAWAPVVLRAALDEILPGIFDLVVAATRGEVSVNKA